jgi:hypothetical protein
MSDRRLGSSDAYTVVVGSATSFHGSETDEMCLRVAPLVSEQGFFFALLNTEPCEAEAKDAASNEDIARLVSQSGIPVLQPTAAITRFAELGS